MTRDPREHALITYHAAGARLGRAGDLTALVRLCDRRLRAHARRLCDDDETARDIVQTAWMAIARALPGLRDEEAFMGFALRIVSRGAARALRARLRQRTLETDWSAAITPEADELPDPLPALAQLPADLRATVGLFYLEEMSVAEVAHALDIPAGTVKSRLHTARGLLRALMTGD